MNTAERLADALDSWHRITLSDVQKAAAELRRLSAELEAARQQMEAQKAEWFVWDAKRKALEKDAERYRWLREYYSPDIGRYASEMDLAFFENDDVLDATIDAAIKGTP